LIGKHSRTQELKDSRRTDSLVPTSALQHSCILECLSSCVRPDLTDSHSPESAFLAASNCAFASRLHLRGVPSLPTRQ
jgi:hypothetical protein